MSDRRTKRSLCVTLSSKWWHKNCCQLSSCSACNMEVHIEYPRYVYCLLLVCRPLPWPSHLLELIVLSVVGLQTSAGAVTSPGANCIVCCWFSDQCRGRHTSWSRLYCLLLVCRPVLGPSHLLELIVLSVVGLQTSAGAVTPPGADCIVCCWFADQCGAVTPPGADCIVCCWFADQCRAVTSPGADCIVCCWFSDQCRGRHTSWSRLYCLLLVCRPVPGPSHLLELMGLACSVSSLLTKPQFRS